MIDFTTLTIVDYTVVFVLFMSAVFSTLRGMTREFLGLLGWVVSVVVANYTKPLLEDPIADLIKADGLSAALAWGLPFAATVIIWFLLASLLSPGLTRAGLGSLDRWLGVIFGVARGYLLVLLAFIGFKMPKARHFSAKAPSISPTLCLMITVTNYHPV